MRTAPPAEGDQETGPAAAAADLLSRPPFTLRAPLLTPLDGGGVRFEPDAMVMVDARGGISSVEAGAGSEASTSASPVVDLRPLVILPGLVDLHAHLPQLPNVGLGAGLDLLTWLERYVFPLERGFDEAAAERLAPLAFRAFAAAGTTTVLMYGAVFEPSLEAAFRAAEAHGIRAILGKVMMDRFSYDERLRPDERLEVSLRQSIDLCERWHGRDDGRLGYAFTPRFAVSCTADLLREAAAAARAHDAYLQTHLSEDQRELAEVARLFPQARDYTDIYDRAGGLGPRTIVAHAIHLAEREVGRLAETGTRVAHCPSSNLFLASGAMPLRRYLEAGLTVGLGSDVAGGPDLSLFEVMKAGAYTQNLRRVTLDDTAPLLAPLDWLRLATLEGARALGLDNRIGSIEVGKEADLIAVDTSLTLPFDSGGPTEPAVTDDPADLMSRLIFRHHPSMVRAAWVRGRLLPA